jgi:electron transfer flavoprotein alpha subunit
MAAGPKTILVCSESPTLIRELAGGARRALGVQEGGVASLVLGDASPVEIEGADVLYQAPPSDQAPESAAAVVTAAAEASRPGLILVGATRFGLLVGPRVAERIGAGYGAWVIDFILGAKDGAVTARSTLYSGAAIAETRYRTGPVVLAIAPGAFEPWIGGAQSPRVSALDVAVPASDVAVVDSQPKPRSGDNLEDANVVVDVGRGVRQREDLALATSLAERLGGKLACSRPLASDRDWFPEWLGLSGRKLAPELVLTLGISGAIQHMVGIRDARVIVAVNNDENAGIFQQADIGVVADLYAFVPALLEVLEARNLRIAASD